MTPAPFGPSGPRWLRASGDRWLFGYADVVTLLFACFAAMYAVQAEPSAPVVSPRSEPPVALPGPPQREPSGGRPGEAPSGLADDIAAIVGAQDRVSLELTPADGGTIISMAEAGSFAPGRADLTPDARRVMQALADTLRDRPAEVRVEGHTDDRPIRSTAFGSNWDLSTARATRVVRFLIEEGGLAPIRLSAAGYGEFRPRVPNDSPAARARNRRVDLVVLHLAAAAQGGPRPADYEDAGARLAGRR